MIGILVLMLLVAVIFYLGLIFESTGFALLGFTTVVFAVLSYLYLFCAGRRVKVKLGVNVKLVEKGQEFGLWVRVKNPSPLPIGKVKVVLSYKEAGDKRFRKVVMGEETRKLSIQAPGYYEFTAKRIRIYDPFGIFHFTRKGESRCHVMVMPELKPIPVKLGGSVRQFHGDSMEYDDLLPGQDTSEVFEIREFKDGDKPQRIHWKLSARTDELMVKEDSLPKACAIVLFMPQGMTKGSEEMDYMASLSFTLMDGKCAHYVVWQSKSVNDLIRIRVQDEESFYVALTSWLQDGLVEYPEDYLERYKEKYKGEQFLHSVSVTGDGKIRVDDVDIFEARHAEGELYLR